MKGNTTRAAKRDIVGTIFISLLVAVFGGIVLHAPLSVGLSSLFPEYEMGIKAWKEILLLVSTALAAGLLIKRGKLSIIKEPLMIGIGIYALIHIVTLVALYQGLAASVAGLMIDLRYILFFALVYIALRLYPQYKKLFIGVGIGGALLVVTFALLQVFVLPIDVLKYIGYNVGSIMPYLTVDQNHDFIRINSTLRGPNPLGAYAVIVLAAVVAWLAMKNTALKPRSALCVAILLVGSIVALWASYSRSALIAAGVAILIVLVALTFKPYKYLVLAIGAGLMIAIGAGLVIGRETDFVSNVILHEDPGEGNEVNSNDGHVDSLQDGTLLALRQPFGAGVGSTGSASLYGESPVTIENQYLFIAHEVGWLGLVLFLLLFIGVLNRLWQQRTRWLGLSVFASGIGLACIGIFLPVWVDDTVAIIWWGLAGIVLAGGRRG